MPAAFRSSIFYGWYILAACFYIFAAVFGFTFLITAKLTTTLVGKLCGFCHTGLISGFITMIHHMSGELWACIGGWSFDTTGS
jgi:hypothetical protein